MLLFDFVMVTLVALAIALAGIAAFAILATILERRRPALAKADCRETVMIHRGEGRGGCD
jgi:hypothetical protein